MNRFFTLALLAFAAIAAKATDFTEPIVVTVNGESSEQTGVITVVQNGHTYDLTLKNFMLASEDGPMGVGNVAISGIVPSTVGDAVILQTQTIVQITPGDDPSVPFWMASILPPVPVDLKGKLENDHLRCFLDIDLTQALQQVIQVTVGKGYQFQNTGFENWHTSTGDYVEPNTWHSFATATGNLAALAGNHISKHNVAHTGNWCASLFSTSIFGIVANGTMTTGRLNAGSMSATDKSNHSYMDISSDDVDGNGDPYYTPMYSRPDSIAVWVKFNQGKPNASYPYATISAVITDGTYYQDPEDKEYTNVVAKAQNSTIPTTDQQWVRVVAPFEYTENPVDPKAILVTMSTNATPGKGSGTDTLFVDDIELIYNASLTSLKVNGKEISGFESSKLAYEIEVTAALTADDITAVADGSAALIEKTISEEEGLQTCQIIVYSGDMNTTTTYTIVAKLNATGIDSVSSQPETEAPVYNLSGQRVINAHKGIYISNGKKYIKK